MEKTLLDTNMHLLFQQMVGEQEQVLTAPWLTPTAARTGSWKKYQAVLNKATVFTFRRRTRTASNLLDKPNQIGEFRAWPEHQRAGSPLTQNETQDQRTLCQQRGRRKQRLIKKTKPPTAQLLQSMKKQPYTINTHHSSNHVHGVWPVSTLNHSFLCALLPTSFWPARHWSSPLKSRLSQLQE